MGTGACGLGAPDAWTGDGAEDVGGLPPPASWEQPVTAGRPTDPATTTTRNQNRERLGHQRTVVNLCKTAGVIERFGFCECCRL
jgi:hypothetical protein